MAHDEIDRWREIVREAADRATRIRNGPVPGAQLQVELHRIASARGMRFPPPGAKVKFSEWIRNFADILLIMPSSPW